MKKYFLLLALGLTAWLPARAIDVELVEILPSGRITATTTVTVRINTTGTALDGINLYMWIFSNAADAMSNNDFCGGPQEPQAVNEGGGIYSYTFRPADVFNVNPNALSRVGLIFKSANPCQPGGNLQTQNIEFDIAPAEFVESTGRLFPRKATDEDIVTFIYNKNLEGSEALKAAEDIYVYAFTDVQDTTTGNNRFVQIADWGNVGTTPGLQMENRGEGIYTLTVIPRRFYPGVAANERVTALKLVVRNVDGSAQSASGNFEFSLRRP